MTRGSGTVRPGSFKAVYLSIANFCGPRRVLCFGEDRQKPGAASVVPFGFRVRLFNLVVKRMVDNTLHFDYETYSEADLKTVGAYAYARHPSTRTLCLALIYRNEKFVLLEGEALPKKWQDRIKNIILCKVAHNVLFDYWIYNFVFRREQKALGVNLPELKLHHCYDNMASCYYYGLPGSLEAATKALGFDQLKFADGRRAMLELSRLGKEAKNYTQKLQLVAKYCLGDVEIQKAIFDRLGKIDDPGEFNVYQFSMKMNAEGIPIDTAGVKTILNALYWFNENIDTLILKLTKNKLTAADLRSPKKMIEFFKSYDVILPNCQADTLEKVRNKIKNPMLKKLIEIRKNTAKSSVKKLLSMEKMSEYDGRARGAVQYYGSHTGRYAGRGFQPLNLFRQTLNDKELREYLKLCKEIAKKKSPAMKDLPLIENMPKTLRRMIKAPKGKKLIWVDYAQIEARVVAWLSGDTALINDFLTSAPGVDVYTIFASKIYNKEITKKDKDERQVGKTAVLGLGFGMGYLRFSDQVEAMTGIQIDHEEAARVVNIYRNLYSRVPGFWELIDTLFRKVVNEKIKSLPLTLQSAGVKLILGWSEKIEGVYITLPAGRSLYYPSSAVTENGIKYINPVTGQYAKLYGGLLTENIVQAIARDLMTAAMLKIPGAILPVHDEIVFETPNKKGIENTIVKKMIGPVIPNWFNKKLIDVEMFSGVRYDK